MIGKDKEKGSPDKDMVGENENNESQGNESDESSLKSKADERIEGHIEEAQSDIEDANNKHEIENKQVETLEADLLYLRAEFENYKKRILREQEQSVRFANEKFIREVLSIIDHLDRAIGHGVELKERNKEDKELFNFVYGVELTQREFAQMLSRFGVEFTGKVGDTFDPAQHEAVFQREIEEEKKEKEGTIVEIVQKGCLLNGRLLKPAKVVVGIPKKSK